MTVKELEKLLAPLSKKHQIAASIFNPITQEWNGADIKRISKVSTPGIIDFYILETDGGQIEASYEKYLKENKK